MVDKFGDYRCENSDDLDHVQALIYSGGLIATIFGIFSSTLFTKCQQIILSLFLNLGGLILAVLSPTLMLTGVGLFLNYSARSIQVLLIPCIIS